MLLMLQHWAQSRNRSTATEEKKKRPTATEEKKKRPTATEEKKKSVLCFGYDFFSWYKFRKNTKIVATRCHIMKLKCTKVSERRRSRRGGAVVVALVVGMAAQSCTPSARQSRRGGAVLPHIARLVLG